MIRGQPSDRRTPLARELFEVTEHFAYFNHAAAGVLPRPTAQALRAFIDAHASGGIARLFPYEARMAEYRRALGQFIGAPPGTVAVLRNTTDGANVIAAGFPWKPGDEIILPDNEFPANVQPWLALRGRGVSIRFIPTARERLTADVLRRHISTRVKIVTLSWVSFEDGYRHDIADLAQVAHESGALLCVDAIQGLGAFPIDVQACGIDALYGGGQKWMLALQGVGFLYTASELIDRLHVRMPGWRSVRDVWDFLNYDQDWTEGTERFEGGTWNIIGAVSLDESIRVLAGAGTARIADHVLELTDRLVEGLHRIGAGVVSLRGERCSSAIVTFRLPNADSVALGKSLQREGFVTTYRPGGVRVSPHGYNTGDEIDALVETVAAYRKVM